MWLQEIQLIYNHAIVSQQNEPQILDYPTCQNVSEIGETIFT